MDIRFPEHSSSRSLQMHSRLRGGARQMGTRPPRVRACWPSIGEEAQVPCVNSATYGHAEDAWLRRKRTVLVACLLTMMTGFPNVWVYALLRFANCFARSRIGICCLVLSTEAVSRKWRCQVGQYDFFFFTAGFLSLPLIAYPTRTSWRSLYQIISLFPLIYVFLLVHFVSESPRWLLVKGRAMESHDVLRKFAWLNGKKLPLTNLSRTHRLPDPNRRVIPMTRRTVHKKVGGGQDGPLPETRNVPLYETLAQQEEEGRFVSTVASYEGLEPEK